MSLTDTALPRFRRLGVPSALALFLLAAATLHVSPAYAAKRQATAASTAAAEAPVRARRARVARPKVQRTGSDESAAERDRRMARECRGRPNAGACLGFGG